jgi:two-component system, OmpR family, alkaline phosphatase synthesis response regulator PhoP
MKPTATQTREPAKPRILIADDHPQGVELLEAYLDKADYEICTAADGEETLARVRDWQPDLILLDIMMPKISGFEVCKRLRADATTSNIAILMITALDQPSDIERALDVRADDFVTKPINKTELLVRVRALLKARPEKNELKRTLAYYQAVDQSKP